MNQFINSNGESARDSSEDARSAKRARAGASSTSKEQDAPRLTSQLTEREREVMKEVAHGLGDKEVAAKLNISVFTVRNHIKSVMRKLNARGRTEAAIICDRLWRSAAEE